MFIHNITVNVDYGIQQDWLNYMKDTYLKQAQANPYILSVRLLKVHAEEEMGGATYSIQLEAATQEDLEGYSKDFENQVHGHMERMFRGKFVAFRTMLESVYQSEK